VRARAPASTANIGPGFDALALALSLYVEVDVSPAERFSITTSGEGADLARDRNHMAARIAIAARGHDRLAIRVHSDIPVGRGLGSSAALAAAAAAAAGAPDPFRVAADTDGHPENAAASALGGLVAAAMLDDGPMATRLPLDPGLAFVVMVPDRRLATAQARAALPAQIPHRDAAFNLGHLALLIAGLGDGRLLAPEMTEDRLHQPFRTVLFPESAALIRGIVERGALASCWSGAGPSLLAICDRGNAGKVRDGAAALLDELGVAGRALLLDADVHGLQVDRDTEPLKE
jgi:homoserine kinase